MGSSWGGGELDRGVFPVTLPPNESPQSLTFDSVNPPACSMFSAFTSLVTLVKVVLPLAPPESIVNVPFLDLKEAPSNVSL